MFKHGVARLTAYSLISGFGISTFHIHNPISIGLASLAESWQARPNGEGHIPETVVIMPRFCGPPGSGNGGYISGLLAAGMASMAGPVQVRFRAPTPLDKTLTLDHGPPAILRDGEKVLAEARPVRAEIEGPPRLVTREEAIAAAPQYRGYQDTPNPDCFVCGAHRVSGDGLAVFAAPVAAADMVAAVWTPGDDYSDEDGLLALPYIWAALDCPGYYAGSTPGEVALSGRITQETVLRPASGEPLLVTGWLIKRTSRSFIAGTALSALDGTLYAKAQQTWMIMG